MAARKLAVNVTALEDGEYKTFLAGTEVSAAVAKGIDNPKAWGEASDEASDGPITGDYADRKVAELQAEVDRRNAARPEADALVVEGKAKAGFVAVLEADDTANSGA